jgi:outer membrane protein W
MLTFEATVIDAQFFLKYYFTNESRFVPYLGLGIGGSSYSQNILGTKFSQEVATCSGILGLELMFNESASMFVELDLMATSEDDIGESFLRSQGLLGVSFHF